MRSQDSPIDASCNLLRPARIVVRMCRQIQRRREWGRRAAGYGPSRTPSALANGRGSAAMAATVVGLYVVGFLMLSAAIPHHYHLSTKEVFGFGTGILALTLGMRHAFDADHIAAIDNTTRKLMSEGKRPLSVGFFFSLGHSSIVFVMAVLLNFGIRSLDDQVKNGSSGLHKVTSIVGTGISGFFLYLIAALNVVILVSILRVFMDMRKGRYNDEELEEQLNKRGLMNRFFGPLARRIDTPWKMYPIGVLFGLGFDTATEVALLVLSGTAVASGLPFYAILSLPILFAAGMSLFDTIDGCFMNFAYGWAFARPIRKVYYNIIITGALGCGGILDRDDRAARPAAFGGQPPRRILELHGQLQHQHGRVHHRRDVRSYLARRPVDLAIRPHRTEVGRGGDAGASEWSIRGRTSLMPNPPIRRPNRPSAVIGPEPDKLPDGVLFDRCHMRTMAVHLDTDTPKETGTV